jgi:hypothetical protein
MTCDERNSFGSLCKLGGLAGPCLAHTDQDLATGRMSCCIMLVKRSHNIALKPDCAAFKGGSQDHFHTMDVDDVRISWCWPPGLLFGVGFCPHSKSIRLWYNYTTQTTFVRREQCTYTHIQSKVKSLAVAWKEASHNGKLMAARSFFVVRLAPFVSCFNSSPQMSTVHPHFLVFFLPPSFS